MKGIERFLFYFLLIIFYFDFFERMYTTVYNISKIKINEKQKTEVDENNIQVEEKLSDDCMDVVEALKVKQTPTLVLDNNTIVSGLSNIQEYFEEQM